MNTTYTLRDLEADDYQQPPRSDREQLTAGDLVKLAFAPTEPDRLTEWMWVIVLARTAGGYVGRLDNVPANIPSLQAGDDVRFGPEHVFKIEPAGRPQ